TAMPTPISTPAPNHARLARMNPRTNVSMLLLSAARVRPGAVARPGAARRRAMTRPGPPGSRVQRCRIQDPDASALLLADTRVAEPGERAGAAVPRRRQPARQLLLRLRQAEGGPVVEDARRLRGL